ncbi:MAG: hypothetical protein ACYC96_09550 [Fimbriimonadaceae bacterium]
MPKSILPRESNMLGASYWKRVLGDAIEQSGLLKWSGTALACVATVYFINRSAIITSQPERQRQVLIQDALMFFAFLASVAIITEICRAAKRLDAKKQGRIDALEAQGEPTREERDKLNKYRVGIMRGLVEHELALPDSRLSSRHVKERYHPMGDDLTICLSFLKEKLSEMHETWDPYAEWCYYTGQKEIEDRIIGIEVAIGQLK